MPKRRRVPPDRACMAAAWFIISVVVIASALMMALDPLIEQQRVLEMRRGSGRVCEVYYSTRGVPRVQYGRC